MEPITSAEYFIECEAIAREAVRVTEGNREQAYDRVAQDIDQHHWIIYTFYNTQILYHSSHEDAYFEDFGSLDAESYSDAVAKMASAAFTRDVYEYLETALSEYEPEDSES